MLMKTASDITNHLEITSDASHCCHGRTCSKHGKFINAYKVLVGRPVQKGSLGRLIRTRQDIIKKELTDVGREGVDWMNPNSGEGPAADIDTYS
jgi:hypothetical protein